MTRLELFYAHAIQGILANPGCILRLSDSSDQQISASEAVSIAALKVAMNMEKKISEIPQVHPVQEVDDLDLADVELQARLDVMDDEII